PDPISWRLQWNNGVRVELAHPWLDCRLSVRPRLAALGVSPCSLRLPASVLATFGAPLNTLQPSGELLIRWPGLQMGRSIPVGDLATLEWRHAGSALSHVQPLGHYQANVKGRDNRLEIEISTVQGPLIVHGK